MPASESGQAANHATSWECLEAVGLAEAVLPGGAKRAADYKLTAAVNMRGPAGAYRGPHFWYLTFKLRALIPVSPDDELGAGGEVFVEVELTERRARVAGHGE